MIKALHTAVSQGLDVLLCELPAEVASQDPSGESLQDIFCQIGQLSLMASMVQTIQGWQHHLTQYKVRKQQNRDARREDKVMS